MSAWLASLSLTDGFAIFLAFLGGCGIGVAIDVRRGVRRHNKYREMTNCSPKVLRGYIEAVRK